MPNVRLQPNRLHLAADVILNKHFLYNFEKKFEKKLKGNCLKENDLKDFSNPNTEDYNAIEETLKGKELKLPDEIFFLDKDGHQRIEIRVKWWEDSSKHNYRTFGVHFDENIPNLPISTDYNF